VSVSLRSRSPQRTSSADADSLSSILAETKDVMLPDEEGSDCSEKSDGSDGDDRASDEEEDNPDAEEDLPKKDLKRKSDCAQEGNANPKSESWADVEDDESFKDGSDSIKSEIKVVLRASRG
jgi:hypothetical protein